ncbi:MAG TPA: class I adenylate-forming enzyme family protein [Candidatus Eisenbacteria bacterium]|nr:class I adenylate-forming enzyme family protein [Candidatus Eisenbacteria bacterium]
MRALNPDFSMKEMFSRAVARWPDLPFWLDRPLDVRPQLGVDLRLAQVHEELERIVEAYSRAGVRPGDRVAVVKQPNLDVMLMVCAAARVGAVPATISPLLPADRLGAVLRRLGRPHLVTDDVTLVPAGGHRQAGLDDLVATMFRVAGSGLEVERHRPADTDGPQIPADTAVLIHTSGTTDVPKVIAYSGTAFGVHTELQVRIAKLVRWKETGAIMMSPAHGRPYSSVAIGLHMALPAVFLTDPGLANVRDMFARHRPGSVETYPNVYVHWEELAAEQPSAFATIKFFLNTFDAAHPRTIRKLLRSSRRRLPMWFQAYGSTECGPLTVKLYTPFTLPGDDARCVGHPIPGYAKIRTRAEASGVRRGRIEASARAVTGPYIAEPERASPVSAPGWWATGDVGYVSRFGCVHLLDRAVDVSEGLPSNLAMEDALLARDETLTEVALIPGVEDLPVPVVCVADDRPLDRERWRRTTADLPALADPVQYRWDDVPRTTTWKVQRVQLRDQLARRDAQPLTR